MNVEGEPQGSETEAGPLPSHAAGSAAWGVATPPHPTDATTPHETPGLLHADGPPPSHDSSAVPPDDTHPDGTDAPAETRREDGPGEGSPGGAPSPHAAAPFDSHIPEREANFGRDRNDPPDDETGATGTKAGQAEHPGQESRSIPPIAASEPWPGENPDDAATTIVTGAAPEWVPGEHPDDEATTIVTSAAPEWRPVEHPGDGATTIVTGGAPEWAPGAHPDDEATTIVTGAAPEWRPGEHPDDEATTIVTLAAPGSEPVGHADDEAATIVMGAVPEWQPGQHPDDESTTVVSITPREWTPGVHPEDEATVLAAQAHADMQGAHDAGDTPYPPRHPNAAPPPYADSDGDFHGAPMPDVRGPGDTTAIVPGSLANGDAVPGQAWFDARLREFAVSLTHDEHGAVRAKDARQALGAAARDMIARTVLQGGPNSGQDWAADTVLQPDQLLANTYIVRSLIARGGIGEIYRVRHRDLKTEHAVKILLPRYALDPTLLSLMLEEARLLQGVRHEAVVGCQGLLRDVDGRPILVMDYIRGRTLSGRLRDGPLTTEELVVLARRLASGLSAIHEAGIVHQDISPDNVMLSEDSVAAATIIDFGLARPLGAGSSAHRNLDFAGKFSWASPEQLTGRPGDVDARSDLYSLGLILIASARGYRLDMGHDMESARAARRTVPSLAGIDEKVAELLRHLLDPVKTARPAAAAAVTGLMQARKRGWLERIFGINRGP